MRANEEEALRQRSFIGRMQQIIKEKEEEKGRRFRFYVETFGCQMNARDSEKFIGILTEIGYVPAESELDADVVLYNTCTVRENANLKVYGRLGKLHHEKKTTNPELKIILCGCMMQEPDEIERIKKEYRFINLVFGTHNIYRFPELLYRMETEKGQIIDVVESSSVIVEDLPAVRKYAFKSGVNIMYGCNNFCSYCIVPYVRGRERSREPEEILCEIERLAKEGVREVMLLGQNVNSYGKTMEHPMTFSELLRKVNGIEGIDRIRFMTSHPKDLSDELIETIASCKKVCNHFHLPLQSGSNEILRRMNRHYTREKYLSIVEKLRQAVPDISITTDIIVGFPGETEQDFLDTLDIVERVRFDSAFTFLYSKRTGTPAASYPDQVSDDVAKERFDRLLQLVQKIGREESGKLTGQTLPVLVEEENAQDPQLVTGRLTDNTVVHFPGNKELIGKIVPVRLTSSKGFYYLGESAGEPY